MNDPIKAWQPLTFGGVARYGLDWIGPLFITTLIVSILNAAAVVWTATRTWEPVVRQAISNLPPGGEIRGGQLTAPQGARLAENDFLSIVLDPAGTIEGRRSSDFEAAFERDRILARSIFGSVAYDYPPHWAVPLNRGDMQSWWEAWRPAVVGNIAAATIVSLYASWVALGIVYAIIPKLIAVARKRHLTIWGAWKLSVAALMPGAIFMAIAIALYAWSMIRMIEVIAALAIHFLIGWIFLIGAAFRLPKMRAVENPFEEPSREDEIEAEPPAKAKNPFSGKGSRGGPPSS